MNKDFRKKYELVSSVIDNLGEEPFTPYNLFYISETVGRKYNIKVTINEIFSVLANLYDSFEINKEVAQDGTVSFRKSELYGIYEDKVSTR